MDVQTQFLSLSKNPDTEGLDLQAGETWIYPTNCPTREYQYNIIQKALLNNTLVSLPTGLGKTFIAAVVMYNFYRWYPHGKIIFMAPTRPLVKQQVEACYNIMAIPSNVTAELTGTKISSSRSNIWRDKRVFFITPQILQNDLENVAELGSKIKCLIFDEAHKARGNHAYCQVVRKLHRSNHKYFRVLALSATPGSNVNDVAEVVQNLLISHLEFRTEESLDVQKYVFQRSLETVVVQLDNKLIEIRDEYIQILEQYVKTLIKFNIVHGNCSSLTKGKIFMLMKDFQSKNRQLSASNYSDVMSCLYICITLYHAFELLVRHGMRSFLSFFDEHIDKPLLRGNIKLKSILDNVRNYLGPLPPIEVLPDGAYPEIPKDIVFGHPKYYKLRDILISHFLKDDKKNTRVIVFFEYRESVMEAHTLLLQSRPIIQPKIFLGQSSGITQKTQLGVIKAFREGRCNTLLSTCIGEEGLDVGEVDLIVCFDISSKSPIRMVQRMGRTGRKRAGSVLVLVTEGKEQQTLKDCLIHKNNIFAHVLGSSHLNDYLYPHNPRLLPPDLHPRCEKMFITVTDKMKKNNIIEKLQKASSSPKIIFSQTEDEFQYRNLIPETRMKLFIETPLARSEETGLFHKHIENMRSNHKTWLVGHSEYSTILKELLYYSDSKRFNIPIKSQVLGEGNVSCGKSLKQGDIRNMFSKEKDIICSSNETIEVSQKCHDDESKHEIQENINVPVDELFKVLQNYLVGDLTNNFLECFHCKTDFCCESYSLNRNHLDSLNNSNRQFLVPSEDVVNSITLDNIEDFITSLDEGFYARHNKPLNSPNKSRFESELSQLRENTFSFEAPKSYLKVLETVKDSDFITQFDHYQMNNTANLSKKITEKTLLTFFKIDSINDIYDNDNNASQNTIIYIPELDLEHDLLNNSINISVYDLPPPNNKISPSKKRSIDLADLCDLSYFGLTNFDKTQTNTRNWENMENENPYNTNALTETSQEKGNAISNARIDKSRLDNESAVTITQILNIFEEPSKNNQPENKASGIENANILNELRNSMVSNISKNNIGTKSQNTSLHGTDQQSFEDINKCREYNSASRTLENIKGSHVFTEPVSPCIQKRRKRKILSKSKPIYNKFLDMEAEVSQDENELISEDEDDTFNDDFEKSFVNDVSQNFNTEMHGLYLRSIRSPARPKKDARDKQLVDRADIYSQLPPMENSEYLEDSFCVKGSDEDLTDEHSLSELDILEKQLEEKRKRKKTALTHSRSTKRKRIKCISSDSE